MPDHDATSILLLGSDISLTGSLATWLRTYVAEPLTIHVVRNVSEALAYLRAHRVDLVFADETAARHDLGAIHTTAPATAVIAVVMRPDEPVLLQAIRQGAHETLCLLPSTEPDHGRIIQRALARVKGRTGILNQAARQTTAAPAAPRLIHDLNNLLTSINGFADLLLNQLAPDHPARRSAEQIRLAGARASTMLKTHRPETSGSPSQTAPPTDSVAVRAA